jgi:hypothetical protein
MLADEFSRDGFLDALRRRHHYGTTGCRMVLDTSATFDHPAERFDNDPGLGPSEATEVGEAMMGDIVRSSDDEAIFRVDALGSSPIERIEIRNGLETLETHRPFGEADLGRRIRIIWEGSEYRGRGRETVWDGAATLDGNRFERLDPINRYNLDKRFEQTAADKVEWEALTTGGFGGFDAWLAEPGSGVLKIETALVEAEIPIAEIGLEDHVFEAGGIARRIRVFRLPDENPHRRVTLERRVSLSDDRDNALYVRLVQEDGHLVWSSPIYIFR